MTDWLKAYYPSGTLEHIVASHPLINLYHYLKENHYADITNYSL